MSSALDSGMKASEASGGYRNIYLDLTRRLAHIDIAASARKLGLALNAVNEAEVPFLGKKYLVSTAGVRRSDGKRFPDSMGSVLCHYILNGSQYRPAGRMATFSELAGPLFKQGSYAKGALERPLIKRFQGCTGELLAAASLLGGRLAGEAGMGAVSLLFDLLPNIPMQVIFYDRDDEFPARATLLYDQNATRFLEFEFLAVLVTLFVQELSTFGG